MEKPKSLHYKAYDLAEVGNYSEAVKLWEEALVLIEDSLLDKSEYTDFEKKEIPELFVKICNNLGVSHDYMNNFDKAEECFSKAVGFFDVIGTTDFSSYMSVFLYIELIERLERVLLQNWKSGNTERIFYLNNNKVVALEFSNNPKITRETCFHAWINLAKSTADLQWVEKYQRPLNLEGELQSALSYAETPDENALYFFTLAYIQLQRETANGSDSTTQSEEYFRKYLSICKKFELPLNGFCERHGINQDSMEKYPPDIPQWRYE